MTRSNIIAICIAATLVALLIWQARTISRLRDDVGRLRDNQSIFASGDGPRLVELVRSEWLRLYPSIVSSTVDSTLRSMGVRAKQIDHYVTTTYVDSVTFDTVPIKIITRVDGTELHTFEAKSNCWTVSGVVNKDTLSVKARVDDRVSTAVYWSWKRWIRPPKRRDDGTFRKFTLALPFSGKERTAVSISECSGDTLSVVRNVEVLKR